MAEAGDAQPRSEKRRRQNILQKRVSDVELDAFKQRAVAAGFSHHRDYLGALIAGKEGFERADRQKLITALGELGKQGSNLNQVAYAVNAGKLKALTENEMKIIEEVRQSIDDVAAELREAIK
jgi:hypothetical protein